MAEVTAVPTHLCRAHGLAKLHGAAASCSFVNAVTKLFEFSRKKMFCSY